MRDSRNQSQQFKERETIDLKKIDCKERNIFLKKWVNVKTKNFILSLKGWTPSFWFNIGKRKNEIRFWNREITEIRPFFYKIFLKFLFGNEKEKTNQKTKNQIDIIKVFYIYFRQSKILPFQIAWYFVQWLIGVKCITIRFWDKNSTC